jgi:uncharacterized protein
MEHNKINMDRRTFLKTTGVGGASLAISSGLAGNVLAVETEKDSSTKTVPTRKMGKSGIPVSILCVGGIDWTSNQNMLRMAFNMGVTMWDTSADYANGKCEIGIGQYFNKYPEDRKKVFLIMKPSDRIQVQQYNEALDSSLKNMNTDYIDLFFLHAIDDIGRLTNDVKTLIDKNKKEGKIKQFGFSTHIRDTQILAQAAALGWIDAIMLSYNYIIMQRDEVKKGLDACAKAGIGLIAIKSQAKGPDSVETPQALEATKHFMEKGYTLEQAKLKAVWSDERITSICSNISNVTILKDNVAAATDNVKLSSRDFRMLNMLAEGERSNYCQGCRKCLSVMGAENRIPDIMRYMMYYNNYGDRDRARNLYRELPGSLKNTLASKDYSIAEAICPHGLQIGNLMRKASSLLA